MRQKKRNGVLIERVCIGMEISLFSLLFFSFLFSCSLLSVITADDLLVPTWASFDGCHRRQRGWFGCLIVDAKGSLVRHRVYGIEDY